MIISKEISVNKEILIDIINFFEMLQEDAFNRMHDPTLNIEETTKDYDTLTERVDALNSIKIILDHMNEILKKPISNTKRKKKK